MPYKLVERKYDMQIGRNDPCPCGSGKKYKNCCLRMEMMTIPDRIKKAVNESGYKEDIGNILANMYLYMEKKQWWGACHATASALYVCLSEIGYAPELCIGEVLGKGLYFDHSWINVDDKIIDLAISMTLLGGAPASEVIVLGKEIKTGLPPILDYGVPGRGIEDQARFVMEIPFVQYMDNFPDEKDGLWGVVREVLNTDTDILSLREKYKETKRVLIRHD
ncbi:MAG: SEC-C domain-containing protein [Saccharofermentans sp.]|nr:SEC-C domain-containing protein [Saccharofermentans sp.]